MPRIDIIHMRDPDSSCDHEVYIDGVQVTYKDDLHFWSYDPGAGYDLDEVAESREDDIRSAPDFLKNRIEEIWDAMAPTYEKWGF
jgi:hypothetical protein